MPFEDKQKNTLSKIKKIFAIVHFLSLLVKKYNKFYQKYIDRFLGERSLGN